MGREKLLFRHSLDNGLILEVWDRSRPVAGDRWLVMLEGRIGIAVNAATLPANLQPQAAAVAAALGREIIFTHRDERHFIAAGDVPEVLKDMENRLLKLAANYLGRADFARNFIRQKYAAYQEQHRWQASGPVNSDAS